MAVRGGREASLGVIDKIARLVHRDFKKDKDYLDEAVAFAGRSLDVRLVVLILRGRVVVCHSYRDRRGYP